MNSTSIAASDSMGEVVRLATALADRVLHERMMGGSVPPEQAHALAKAARLLQDAGVPWPSLVTQVLHEIAGTLEGAAPQAADTDQGAPDLQIEAQPDPDERGVLRFLNKLRKKTGNDPGAGKRGGDL